VAADVQRSGGIRELRDHVSEAVVERPAGSVVAAVAVDTDDTRPLYRRRDIADDIEARQIHIVGEHEFVGQAVHFRSIAGDADGGGDDIGREGSGAGIGGQGLGLNSRNGVENLRGPGERVKQDELR
jgi:hypothetical protein